MIREKISELLWKLTPKRMVSTDENGYPYHTMYVPEDYIDRVYSIAARERALEGQGNLTPEIYQEIHQDSQNLVIEMFPWIENWNSYTVHFHDIHPKIERFRVVLFGGR